MTEMHNLDVDTAQTDLPIADDLAPEPGDEVIRSALDMARSAWLSTPETRPNDDLRAFMTGVTQSADRDSPRRRKRWTTLVMATIGNLWPPSSRVAFGASLAAVVGAVAVAGVALGDPDRTTAASPASTSTSITAATTPTTPTAPTTPTTNTIPPTVVADRSATRITVADAGTADVMVSDGVPVLVAADPAPGWRVVEEVPDEPYELDLSYRRGDERVDLTVEIEDGELRIRTRDRRTDTRTESYLGSSTHTTDHSPGDPVPIDDDHKSDSVDDEDDPDTSGSGSGPDDEPREDNSGPGNADDRDRSSSGSGSDDGDREDNSGPGSDDGS